MGISDIILLKVIRINQKYKNEIKFEASFTAGGGCHLSLFALPFESYCLFKLVLDIIQFHICGYALTIKKTRISCP